MLFFLPGLGFSCYEDLKIVCSQNRPSRREKTMETCTLSHFMETLKPWLDRDYIHRATVDEAGRFVLLFADGGQRVFELDGCSRQEVETVIEMMRNRGIRVEP